MIVAMQHTAKGRSKVVRECSLPLTSARPVDLLVTELAVIAFPDGRATLIETADGVSVDQVLGVTEAELVIPRNSRRRNEDHIKRLAIKRREPHVRCGAARPMVRRRRAAVVLCGSSPSARREGLDFEGCHATRSAAASSPARRSSRACSLASCSRSAASRSLRGASRS